jgi:predicted GTPase
MSKTTTTKRKSVKGKRTKTKKSDAGLFERALRVIKERNVFETMGELIASKADDKVPREDLEKMRAKVEELASFAPTVCFFGKPKTGRSSICGKIFSKDHIEISSVEACAGQHKPFTSPGSRNEKMRIVNMPEFVPEDGGDDSYRALCEESMSKADVVLWALKAGDAKGIDAASWKIIRPIVENLSLPAVFVLTQVDTVEPSNEWLDEKNLPSAKQMGNILIEKKRISKELDVVSDLIVPVSVAKKFGLSELLLKTIQSIPDEKKAGFLRFTNRAVRTGQVESEAEGGFVAAMTAYAKNAGIAVWEFCKEHRGEIVMYAVQFAISLIGSKSGGSAAPRKVG